MVVGAAILTTLVWLPIATTLTRVAELSALALVTLCVATLAWPDRRARRVVFGVLAVVLACFASPWGGTVTAAEERAGIARAALAYADVSYVWGGESPRGIDCSGLIRRAYQDAALTLAVTHLSSQHLRRAARLWLFDQPAKDFEGHAPIDGQRLSQQQNLVGTSPDTLQTGDLAVVAGGLHVLLYLGDSRWIQADPSLHRVHDDDARTSRNVWLREPAVLLRPAFLADLP